MARARRADVHGVGNALVDVQARVDDEVLRDLGLVKGRTSVVDDARQADVLDALRGSSLHRSSGGSAANTVAGVAELGGTATYAGRVGSDELGEFFVEDMLRLGVTVHARRGRGRTGTVLVLVTPDAQRTMLTNLGASGSFGAEDLDEKACAAARWVYVEGYLLPGEVTRGAALAALRAGKAAGAHVALTLSDPFVATACRDLLWEIIRSPLDLLYCNEIEGAALTGRSDPLECAREIRACLANVVLTLGPRGALILHGDAVHAVEGVPVEAVDTTGAGDMHAAGFLYGITHGLSWPAAGRLASHAAARVVTHYGARLPRRFTAEEIRALAERA